MFNFSDSFVVSPFLLLLVLFVALSEWCVTMALCEWVKNPHIKKCTLPIGAPKTLSCHIQAGSIFPYGRPVCELLVCNWLQSWFCAHIVAYLAQQVCSDVSHLIVADLGEASSGAAQGVLHCKLFATDAVGWEVGGTPSIA